MAAIVKMLLQILTATSAVIGSAQAQSYVAQSELRRIFCSCRAAGGAFGYPCLIRGPMILCEAHAAAGENEASIRYERVHCACRASELKLVRSRPTTGLSTHQKRKIHQSI